MTNLPRIRGMVAYGTPAETAQYFDLNFASVGVSTETGTDYTFRPTDSGGWVRFTSSSAVTATIAPFSSIELPFGAVIMVEQAGTGLVTIAAGAGVTVYGVSSVPAQYSVLRLVHLAQNVWSVTGAGEAGNGFSGYDTRTAAEAASITASTDAIQTSGYATVGDGGGAIYYRASGSTSGGFQSLDGAWWAIAKSPVLYAAAFGHATTATGAANLAALQAAVALAASWGAAEIRLGAGSFDQSAVLTISDPFIRIVGVGSGIGHAAVGQRWGTRILYTGGVDGTHLFDFEPRTGERGLEGVGLVGVYLDGNLHAGCGLSVKSVKKSEFGDLQFTQFKAGASACIYVDVMTTLAVGENRDTQYNDFHDIGWRLTGAGGDDAAGLILTGDSSANTSLNTFVRLTAQHYNNLIVLNDADNNTFQSLLLFRFVGGSGYGMVFSAGSSALLTGHENLVIEIAATGGVYAEGTENGDATASANNRIINYNVENSGAVVVGTGAILKWDRDYGWRDYSATVTSSGGTITTVSSGTRYLFENNKVNFSTLIHVTTNGTGSGHLKVTLPVASANRGAAGIGFNSATSKAVVGYNAIGNDYVDLYYYDSTYPAADGHFIQFSIEYEVAVGPS